MVPFEEQVAAAGRWLALHARPAARPDDSYRLKHLVQAWVGHYVSSRAVVAAATAAGFAVVGQPTRAGNARLALRVAPPGVA